MSDTSDQSEWTLEIDADQTLDSLAHQVLNHALVRIRADAGSLMLVDHDQGILQVKARLGPPRPGRRVERVFRLGEGIAGTVAMTARHYRCDDVRLDPAFAPSRSGVNFRSLLSVPVVYEGRSVAVINADSEQPGQFSEDAALRLCDVANAIAAPLARKVGILDALLEVGKDLTQLPRQGGVDIVLKNIAEAAVRALGADIVTLYQYDQSDDEFLVEGTGPTIAGELREPAPMRTKVYPDDVPFHIVRSRQSAFHHNVEQQEFLHRHIKRPGVPRPRFVDREGIKSMAALLLPFSVGDADGPSNSEIVGVMFANYRSHHSFNIDERKALATFADFAAVAILNARNDERRIRESGEIITAVQGSLAHRMSRLWQASSLAVKHLTERIPPDDLVAHQHLAVVNQQSERLFALAKRLQERIQVGITARADAVKLPAPLNRVLTSFAPDFERSGIQLIDRLPKQPIMVRSDDFHLQQLVYDLLRNAIESIEEMRNRYPSHLGELHVSIENINDESVDVVIRDNGVGIPASDQGRIFLPGVTTKNTLGLGLWWSRTFARATGGDLLLLSSGVEEGAAFALRLPRHRSIMAPANRDRGSVLVVEDDLEFLQQAVQIFQPLRCRVDAAASLEEAREYLGRNSYDLMMLDVNLDDTKGTLEREGLQLLAELSYHATQTRVILVSGRIDLSQLGELQARNPAVAATFEKLVLDPRSCRDIARQIFLEHGKTISPDSSGVEF